MCYSGQCYMSSVIGGRSGNRGKCAQPCRKLYENGYELSLKDLCMANALMEFKNCGVHSFKIEGRMKSPEYVAGVVSVYRKLIDENRNANECEIKTLTELFSREGFTNAYFEGVPSKKMFGIRTTEDKQLTRNVKVEYSERKIPVSAVFTGKIGKKMNLKLTALGKTAQAEGQIPFMAEKVATTIEECNKQLSKLGETRFEMVDFKCFVDDGLFIPIGALNKLRRSCIDELQNLIERTDAREFKYCEEETEQKAQNNIKIAFCNTSEQAEAVSEYVDQIRMPLHLINKNYSGKVCAVLPDIIFDRESDAIKNKLTEIKRLGITDVACGNIGHIKLCKDLEFAVHGDTGLNVYNSQSIKMANELGLKSVSLSFELNTAQSRDIKKALPCNSVVYGRYKVMTIQNCLMKNRGECINFKGYDTLNDETGRTFVVFCHPPHRNVIYNSVPLYLGDKPELIAEGGQIFLFTTESGKEAQRILMMYEQQEKYKGDFTRGFTNKKV